MEVVLIKVGIWGFLSGSVLGSLCLVLAARSLTKQSFWGRSYCPHCKKKLRWYDLFPILSFIFLQGKCRYCHKKIGIEYLLVEVVMGLLIGYLFWSFDFAQDKLFIFLPDLIFRMFFITVLAVLFITDLKKMLIPDRIILPALFIGLVSTLFVTVGKSGILMAFLIGGFFMTLIIITKGKGMGGGDVKLGAFIGLMLGFPQGLVAVISAFISGAVFSLMLIVLKKRHFGQSIPFGPFLVLGSLVSLFWGNQIIDWYLISLHY